MPNETTDRDKLEMLCRFVHQGFGWSRLANEYPDVHQTLIEVLGADYQPGETETVYLTENQQRIMHRALRRSLRIIG